MLGLAPYTIEPSARYVAERRAVARLLICGTYSCTAAWQGQDATGSGRSGSQSTKVLGAPSSKRSTEKLCSKRPRHHGPADHLGPGALTRALRQRQN